MEPHLTNNCQTPVSCYEGVQPLYPYEGVVMPAVDNEQVLVMDQDYLKLPNLQRLSMRRILGASLSMIESCRETLTELKIDNVNLRNFKLQNNFKFNKMLKLQLNNCIDTNSDNIFGLINAVKETVTLLSICNIVLDNERIEDFERFPCLTNLTLCKINTSAVLPLIKLGIKTLTKLTILEIDFTYIEINDSDVKIPSLKSLFLGKINGTAAVKFIKPNEDTLTELMIAGVDFGYIVSELNEIKMPKLAALDLVGIFGSAALALIRSGYDTLTDLKIQNFQFDILEMTGLKIPNLENLDFSRIHHNAALSFLKASGDYLESVIIDGRHATEVEIYNLKLEGLIILQPLIDALIAKRNLKTEIF